MKAYGKTNLKEYYEKKAAGLDEVKVTYRHPSLYKRFFYNTRFAKVFSLLDPRKGEIILDLGCGPGYYTKKIIQKGARVFAVELAKNYLNQAKKFVGENKNVEFLVADATRLPFPKEYFDKVLFTEVIEHIPNYKESLKETKRVLKREGVLVISTPSKFSPLNLAYSLKRKLKHYTFNEHVHEFTSAEFKKVVGQYFRIERLEFVNFLLPYPVDNLFLGVKSKNVIKFLDILEKLGQNLPLVKYLGWTMVVLAKKN